MTTETLEQIVADIDQLALPDQLWLMERLAHRIRQRTLDTPTIDEQALLVMADDPAIQQELDLIAAEFASAEADGLDDERCCAQHCHATNSLPSLSRSCSPGCG